MPSFSVEMPSFTPEGDIIRAINNGMTVFIQSNGEQMHIHNPLEVLKHNPHIFRHKCKIEIDILNENKYLSLTQTSRRQVESLRKLKLKPGLLAGQVHPLQYFSLENRKEIWAFISVLPSHDFPSTITQRIISFISRIAYTDCHHSIITEHHAMKHKHQTDIRHVRAQVLAAANDSTRCIIRLSKYFNGSLRTLVACLQPAFTLNVVSLNELLQDLTDIKMLGLKDTQKLFQMIVSRFKCIVEGCMHCANTVDMGERKTYFWARCFNAIGKDYKFCEKDSALTNRLNTTIKDTYCDGEARVRINMQTLVPRSRKFDRTCACCAPRIRDAVVNVASALIDSFENDDSVSSMHIKYAIDDLMHNAFFGVALLQCPAIFYKDKGFIMRNNFGNHRRCMGIMRSLANMEFTEFKKLSNSHIAVFEFSKAWNMYLRHQSSGDSMFHLQMVKGRSQQAKIRILAYGQSRAYDKYLHSYDLHNHWGCDSTLGSFAHALAKLRLAFFAWPLRSHIMNPRSDFWNDNLGHVCITGSAIPYALSLVPKQKFLNPGYMQHDSYDVDMPVWLGSANVTLSEFVDDRVKCLRYSDKTGDTTFEIIVKTEFKIHVVCSHPSNKKTILEFFVVTKMNPAQHVTNYHLGPVRAWFDGDRFKLMSTAVMSYVWSVMWDIRFVAGQRSPERIIMKYLSRNFMMACNVYEKDRMREYAAITGESLQVYQW